MPLLNAVEKDLGNLLFETGLAPAGSSAPAPPRSLPRTRRQEVHVQDLSADSSEFRVLLPVVWPFLLFGVLGSAGQEQDECG